MSLACIVLAALAFVAGVVCTAIVVGASIVSGMLAESEDGIE